MRTSTDRILVTHVGSLPRPQAVVDRLARKEAGEPFDRTAFDAAMDEAVAEVVRRQRAAGVDVVSDGEQSKPSYATYVKDRLSGFSGASPGLRGADLDDFPGFFRKLMSRRAGAIRLARPCCTGPVAMKDRAPLDADLARFRAALAGSDATEGFMNAASPGVIAVFHANRHYATQRDYLAALADAMRDEYRAIVDAGLLLQVDCPDLAMGRHLTYKTESDDAFIRRAEEQVEALNHALAGIPADRVRVHLCWGNYEGPHHRDISLAAIFGTVMKVKAGALLFEAANPRHAHEWAVFAERKGEIPQDLMLVPGVIQSTSNYVEHPQLVAERLVRFAEIVGRERVTAGSDCGFSTFAGDALIDPEICYAKLAAMAEGAVIASQRLWPGARATSD